MNSYPTLKKITGLEFLEKPGTNEQTVLIFHGYGADAYDLFPLSAEIRSPARFIFPQGPLTVPIGPGMVGRSWFPIEVKDFDFRKKSAKPMRPSVDMVMKLIRELQCPADNLILGGFSQGAMLVTELALHLPTPPKALVLLSGTLTDEDRWLEEYKKRPNIRVFQAHGKFDEVLQIEPAEKLAELFVNAGLKSEFMEFDGGHEIPRAVLERVSQFLKTV